MPEQYSSNEKYTICTLQLPRILSCRPCISRHTQCSCSAVNQRNIRLHVSTHTISLSHLKYTSLYLSFDLCPPPPPCERWPPLFIIHTTAAGKKYHDRHHSCQGSLCPGKGHHIRPRILYFIVIPYWYVLPFINLLYRVVYPCRIPAQQEGDSHQINTTKDPASRSKQFYQPHQWGESHMTQPMQRSV